MPLQADRAEMVPGGNKKGNSCFLFLTITFKPARVYVHVIVILIFYETVSLEKPFLLFRKKFKCCKAKLSVLGAIPPFITSHQVVNQRGSGEL